MLSKNRLLIGLLIISHSFCFSQDVYTIDTKTVKASIQPTMWGVFFEDINMAADGGIYAELVKNRSFEFSSPMMGWEDRGAGNTLIINRGAANAANPRFARVTVEGGQPYMLSNEGFRAMAIQKVDQYNFSVLARAKDGNVKISVQLVNASGAVLGQASLEKAEGEWKKYTATFTASDTALRGQLNLVFEGKGDVDIDMVSLFPQHTWKNRPGGLRADLVQLLADMKPGFVRFPGGCIVEGQDLSKRYQWKKTLGAVEGREVLFNKWNNAFSHRSTPDYYQSFGLGFYEYFQLCEDIGASPLPTLNCGMACQFDAAEVVPVDQLDPYIQDALDLVEFANGDVTTEWGKKRAALGHPAPFNLKTLGIGNENFGPQYLERLKLFTQAIKDKYPGIRLVNSSGYTPSGELFDYMNGELRAMKVDVIDEHYYSKPDWFLKNAARYDNYDRKGPKIFAGEYAAQSDRVASPNNKNTLRCALAEAAFMTGLERNADVVTMASYAPLFGNVDAWQWTPDLIWFDNMHSYGTPDYYVQKLFSLNKGTDVVPMLLNGQPVTGQDNCYASACIDKPASELIIKLVNAGSTAKQKSITLESKGKLTSTATMTVLKSDSPDDKNSLDKPMAVSPADTTIAVKGKSLQLTLPPYSFTVIRIKGSAL